MKELPVIAITSLNIAELFVVTQCVQREGSCAFGQIPSSFDRPTMLKAMAPYYYAHAIIVVWFICTCVGESVWPKPQKMVQSAVLYDLHENSFTFTQTGYKSEIVDKATKRYRHLVFYKGYATPAPVTPDNTMRQAMKV